MRTFIMGSEWSTVKRRLMREYSALTDDDLFYEAGKEDELILKLQQTLGKTREETIWILRSRAQTFAE